MRKSELFRAILESVAYETEVDSGRILSHSRVAEVVDARHIIVRLLWRENMYIVEIARFMNLSRRAVERIVSSFDSRLKSNRRQLKLAFDRVSNDLRTRGVITD